MFIDPFSEAIKAHDVMDIGFSKFRKKDDPRLFDDRILIINSEITNRTKLAHTLDYLSSKDVAVIALDLLFDSLHIPAEDSLFKESILKSPRLVFGNAFVEGSGSDLSSIGVRTHEYFLNGKEEAFVNIASNDGFSVRAFEPVHLIDGKEELSFAVKVSSYLDPSILSVIKDRNNTKEWINFRRLQPGMQNMIYPINSSKAVHYTMIEIDQFLLDTAFYSKDMFKNKIVLIGFCGEYDRALSMKDRYFTPLNEQYTGRSLPDMHGVVVHANIISMLLDNDYIFDVPSSGIYLLAFLLFVLNYFVFNLIHFYSYFRSIPYIRLIQVLEFFILLTVCLVLLLNFNIKLAFSFSATCIILSYELLEIYDKKLKSRVESLAKMVYMWIQRAAMISRN